MVPDNKSAIDASINYWLLIDSWRGSRPHSPNEASCAIRIRRFKTPVKPFSSLFVHTCETQMYCVCPSRCELAGHLLIGKYEFRYQYLERSMYAIALKSASRAHVHMSTRDIFGSIGGRIIYICEPLPLGSTDGPAPPAFLASSAASESTEVSSLPPYVTERLLLWITIHVTISQGQLRFHVPLRWFGTAVLLSV